MGEALIRGVDVKKGTPIPGTVWTPPLTLWEDASLVVMLFELSGVARHAVEVFAAPSDIVVSGFRASPFERAGAISESGRVSTRERPFGTFRRAVAVPRGFDPTLATARLADGVLEIRIQRVASGESGVRPRPIGAVAIGAGPIGTGPIGTGPISTGPISTGPISTGGAIPIA